MPCPMIDSSMLTSADRKTRGNVALANAISWLVERGFVVYLPVTDNEAVDLVALRAEHVFRVSVKSTSTEKRPGSFEVALRTTSRRKDNTCKVNFLDKNQIDVLLVYVRPLRQIVWLPIHSISGRSSVCVSPSGQTPDDDVLHYFMDRKLKR